MSESTNSSIASAASTASSVVETSTKVYADARWQTPETSVHQCCNSAACSSTSAAAPDSEKQIGETTAATALDPALAAMMAQMELEAEEIDEDPQALASDLKNRSLRMLTPAQVEEEKQKAEREKLTPAKLRALMRKKIRQQQADRKALTSDQRPTDARGRRLPGRPRLTKQQMQKAQNGQLGAAGAGAANLDNITPEQMAQATAMLKQNPHLMP